MKSMPMQQQEQYIAELIAQRTHFDSLDENGKKQ